MESEEKIIEVNDEICDCEMSWSIQYKTEYSGGRAGYKYGCVDVAICPCGHRAVLTERLYN